MARENADLRAKVEYERMKKENEELRAMLAGKVKSEAGVKREAAGEAGPSKRVKTEEGAIDLTLSDDDD